MAHPLLSTAQLDRAAGALLASAAGDALGAGYEFGPPLRPDQPVGMTGGGAFRWERGEWTDDTSMALVIADAATTADLRNSHTQDTLAADWNTWSQTAPDVGAHTSAVLRAAATTAHQQGLTHPTAAILKAAAHQIHQLQGRSGGNGSLMRTAPVALAYLHDPDALAGAARRVSALTHPDPDAGDACVIWCATIAHAILTGTLDITAGLALLPPARAATWQARLDEAARRRPADYTTTNGWVVAAAQGAWSAICTTPVPALDPAAGSYPAQHLARALETAVRGGGDTDTVAAIAGGLLGATYGASAVPAVWRRILHGWPGRDSHDLIDLATRLATGANSPFVGDYAEWGSSVSACVPHPYDPQLYLGGVGALRELPAGVDAVVSLCRVAPTDRPAGIEHIDVRLVDQDAPAENPNLDFVLADTADLLTQLRSEGRTVLLHCVAAHSRTPTVAALYGSRLRTVPTHEALADVLAALPAADPIPAFRHALTRFDTRSDQLLRT